MALSYNLPRFSQSLLSKYKKSAPSFSIDLFDDHWTLNKGPNKFLYTQPVSGLLDEVRALRIPVDFIEIFEMANVPYYEGCMIVESVDHRKPRLHVQQQATSKEPECVRVVLQPTGESFYADLCLLNAKNGNTWTDQEALEVEAKILNATCPPLCLDPDVNLTRIVNTMIRASTPSDSVVLKRKQVHEPEEDENDKAKRAKLWSQYMHPHNGKPSSQARPRSMFDILNEIAQKDEKGAYSLKWKQPKNEAPTMLYQPPGQPQINQTFAPPNTNSAPPSLPPVIPQEEKLKMKVKLVTAAKNADAAETLAAVVKGKKNPGMNAPTPAPVPSPAPAAEQRRVGSAVPGVSRTPVEATAAAATTAKSPHPTPQFQPQPQASSTSPHPPVLPNVPPPPPTANSKKRGVLKRSSEDQGGQPAAAHPQLQPQQPNSSDAQTNTWQPPIPPAQYLSQPPQKKQPPPQQQPQPRQTSPYHPHTPVPGFANTNGYPPQSAGYKNPGGMVQHPNMNPNRGSPMTHNQPLLSRDPLPPAHSQSPHPPSQPQLAPTVLPQHQMTHPAHQFNMHLPQNRYNSAMQAQPGGHHPQQMAQHPMAQQHHPQPGNAPRSAAPGQHDPSQGSMMHPQMPYNPMFPYQMHMQGMMNGVRMPNMPSAQGGGGQYMTAPTWRIPAGRGGGPPMTSIPMQYQQQQQMMAAMNRAAQAQQAQQPQGQGR